MVRLPLPKKIKIVLACVPSAGAATSMTAVEVNATGYDRAMYVLATGAQATGATLALKIQDATATGGSFADVTSAALVNLGASSGSKVYAIDFAVDPARPFQKIVGTVGTDTLANAVICILYNGRNFPVDTSYATQLVSPS